MNKAFLAIALICVSFCGKEGCPCPQLAEANC